MAYELNVFSDFTNFLDDPVHGDQIQQVDQRWATGVNLSHTWNLGQPKTLQCAD